MKSYRPYSFTLLIALAWVFLGHNSGLAYDLTDPYAAEAMAAGSPGRGQDGMRGMGNRSVQQFSQEYHNYRPSGFGRPVMEAPIVQENYAGNHGPQIYDYNQVEAQRLNGISGTSFTQAAMGIASRGQQTSSKLLSSGSPGAYTQIPGGTFNFGFNGAGDPSAQSAAYRGLNYNTMPQLGSKSMYGTLPPTSLGSVELNVIDNNRLLYTPSMIYGPTQMSH